MDIQTMLNAAYDAYEAVKKENTILRQQIATQQEQIAKLEEAQTGKKEKKEKK